MKDLVLAKKQHPTHRSYVKVGSATFGQGLVVCAGPCSVEDENQILTIARQVKEAKGQILRGGAFKPRTSPYAFQGLGLKGLQMMSRAREETGLPIVTEVMDPRDVPWVSEYADMLQIGTRNMQNFALLKEVGKSGRPVLLKRGMYSTLEEWLYSAEYIMSEGNDKVVLCERGIRTHEKYTRNTLDLSAVPALRELTHLPVITDPSHGTGRSSLVPQMCLASVASGADGVIIEVHHDPQNAASDKDQTLDTKDLDSLIRKMLSLQAALKELT